MKHLIVKYDAASEFCELIHPHNKRFHDLVKAGVKPLAYRQWNGDTGRWRVHITRLPMVVAYGKRYFDHVDYSSLPDSVQIELVRLLQIVEQRCQTPPPPVVPRKITRPEQAYQALYLLPTAPPEVVRAAYRALALLLHPDRGGNEEAFQHLQTAYEVLKKE